MYAQILNNIRVIIYLVLAYRIAMHIGIRTKNRICYYIVLYCAVQACCYRWYILLHICKPVHVIVNIILRLIFKEIVLSVFRYY